MQHVPLFLCSLLARIMAQQPVQHFYWPENAIDCPEPAHIMNMRNATCVRTKTSKDPTRVALLFISYSMKKVKQNKNKLQL